MEVVDLNFLLKSGGRNCFKRLASIEYIIPNGSQF